MDPADIVERDETPAAEPDPAAAADAAVEGAPLELPDIDAAAVVERGDTLPTDIDVSARPINRRSPFYLGFVGALGVLVAWGLVQLLGDLSHILTSLAVAVFLALGLNPAVESLMRRGLSRGWAVLAVFTGLVTVFTLIGLLVVPPVVTQTQSLFNEAPRLLEDLQGTPAFQRFDAKYDLLSRAQKEIEARVTSGDTVTTLFGGVLGAGKAILDGLVGAFTVLVLTLYFLVTLPKAKAATYRLVPLTRRARVVQLSEEISRRVGGYVMGQVVVAATNAVFALVMLLILDLPYAAIIAVTVGFLALIPILGTLVGGVVVVLVALLSSWQAALIMLIYYIFYHFLESYLIAPRIMRRAVEVPPAVTIIALLAGGTLLGVVGALIAIPVAAGLLLIYEEVVVPRQQQS